MKIGMPQLILDPYNWLPSDGESKVSFRSVGLDVILDVEYEKELQSPNGEVDEVICRREILFKFARYFIRTPFPGGVLFEYDENSPKLKVGGLTEFLDSEFAKNSVASHQTIYGGKVPKMRHFTIHFLAVNIGFHVLAEDVFCSEELPKN